MQTQGAGSAYCARTGRHRPVPLQQRTTERRRALGDSPLGSLSLGAFASARSDKPPSLTTEGSTTLYQQGPGQRPTEGPLCRSPRAAGCQAVAQSSLRARRPAGSPRCGQRSQLPPKPPSRRRPASAHNTCHVRQSCGQSCSLAQRTRNTSAVARSLQDPVQERSNTSAESNG